MIKVLDSSALLAVILDEPGRDLLTTEFLRDSIMSVVNLAEVHGKLVGNGGIPEQIWKRARTYLFSVEPFTEAQAKLAGSLVAQTKQYGLSLGDRACLALALTLDAPVYTTDRAWTNLNVGCRIHLLR